MWIFGRHRHLSADRLADYVSGRLTAQERSRIEGALAECSRCREELESLQETRSLLQALPDFTLPRSFVLPAAPAHIPESGPTRSAIGWPRVPVWAYAGAASVAAVAIFLFVATDGGRWLPGMTAMESSEPASELAMAVPESSSEVAAPAPAQQMAADHLPREELAAVPQSMPAAAPAAAPEIPVAQEATVEMEREVVAEVEPIREVSVEKSVEVLQESIPTPAAMAQDSMAQTESFPGATAAPAAPAGAAPEPGPTPDSSLPLEPTAAPAAAAAARAPSTPLPTAVPETAVARMGEASIAGQAVPTPTLGPLATAAPPPRPSDASLSTPKPEEQEEPGDEQFAGATPVEQARASSAGRAGPTMVFTPEPTVAPVTSEPEPKVADVGTSPDASSQIPTPETTPVALKETDALGREPQPAQPAPSKGIAGSEAGAKPAETVEPPPEAELSEAEAALPAVVMLVPSATPDSQGSVTTEGEELIEEEQTPLPAEFVAEGAPAGDQGGREDYQESVEEGPGLNWLLAFAVTTTVLAVLALVAIAGLRRLRARNSTPESGTKGEAVSS